MRKLLLVLGIALLTMSMANAQGMGIGLIVGEDGEVGGSMSIDWRNQGSLGKEYILGIEGGIFGRQAARAEGYYANCSSYSCYSGYSDGYTPDGKGGWFVAGRYLLPLYSKGDPRGHIIFGVGPQFNRQYANGYKADSSMGVYGKIGYTHTRKSIGYELAATTVGGFVGMTVKF